MVVTLRHKRGTWEKELKRNILVSSIGEVSLPIQIKTRYDVPGRKQSGGLCGQLLPRPSMASSPELRRKAGRCICFPSVGLSQAVRQSDTVVGESILKGKEIYPAFSNQVHGWKGRSEMTSLLLHSFTNFRMYASTSCPRAMDNFSLYISIRFLIVSSKAGNGSIP